MMVNPDVDGYIIP